MKISGWLAIGMAMPLLLGTAAQAAQTPGADAPTTANPAVDAEEKLDEGLKGFGYLAGLARGCVTATQQTALDREAMDLHTSIGRLLGTDRAFLFSTSFGYGSSVKVEIKDCAEVLKNYEARVEKHRAASGRPQ